MCAGSWEARPGARDKSCCAVVAVKVVLRRAHSRPVVLRGQPGVQSSSGLPQQGRVVGAIIILVAVYSGRDVYITWYKHSVCVL